MTGDVAGDSTGSFDSATPAFPGFQQATTAATPLNPASPSPASPPVLSANFSTGTVLPSPLPG